MCKKMKTLFCLSLVIILTACNAKENNSNDNVLATEIQTEKPIAIPTSIPVATPTEAPTPRPKGDIPERSYDSHRDFPYENRDFVDDTTYAFLKQTYGEINFYGEFQTDNLSKYDEYIEA